jgi:hypothetical protein
VGTTSLSLRPKTLRVSVELVGKGKDLKTAMANLKDRRDAVKIQLATLKADMNSLNIGPPVRAGISGQQEQQMRAMIMQRARERGGAAPSLPSVVTVSAPLTVEWTLTGDDDDSRLVAAGELCDKITAADLGGTKEKRALTPEQQEVQEELAQMSSRYGGENGPAAGEPQFVYVAVVSDEQASQAMSEAFGRARKQADRIAKAIGGEIGALRRVDHSNVAGPEGMDMENYNYYAARMYGMGMARRIEAVAPKANEVVSQDPNRATYRVSIACGFDLK